MTEVTTSATSATIDMSVDLAGMALPNPLMTASGCAANGKELHRFFDIAELGAFVTKTVLADPRSGRGTPRMAETPSGMLNSIGLQGPGITAFAQNDLVWLKSVPTDGIYHYPPTWAGLLHCYEMAIPFFRNQFLGDGVFSFAFFGIYLFLEQRYLVKAEKPAAVGV